ncbi:ribonuclease P 40kDa subunit-domain-containing protein [Radiomyces spectabilis]|uniref:ribonuclease P 40kDa subunit-domain-containing protein n=1 Tax=Radiomyces spectabilis TaxID=64574 RepID=UPI00221E9BFE|nr:ribonuclease P 40kDa subunit-domain-containing protein [Radiomyces spectabilis]KAI8367520.1 ribonuclease P 40kDa subunit-domain-containing protein [Radiomyces spectabilis]
MSEAAYLNHPEIPTGHADVSALDLNKHTIEWQATIDNHPFNHKLAIFLPFCTADKARQHLQHDVGAYYKVEAKLSDLLEPGFCDLQIQSPSRRFIFHSIDTQLDTDDVVVLDLNGNLTFSLLKSTYEELGLEGRKQSRGDVRRQKHIVQINLRDAKMKPGDKRYDRLLWCLQNNLDRPFKIVAALIDTETGNTEDIPWPKNIRAEKVPFQCEYTELSGVNIPSFEGLNQDGQVVDDWLHRVSLAMEWLGLAHVRAKRLRDSDRSEPYISVYKEPQPSVQNAQGTLVQWKGLIPPSFIKQVMINLRKMMLGHAVESWASLTVWGFRDSPFTWNDTQHYHFLNGENDYTFFLQPCENDTQKAVSYVAYGSHHSNYR